jgi:NAD-dependent SIR2 family protein deacetylase
MASERPNRNVYILGAGFSAPAGAPVVRNFLDRSREFYDDPRSSMDDEERERFSKVFKFKRSMGQAREKFTIDLDDIEKLFGLVEISERLGEDVGETRDDIVYLIAKTLQLAISWPPVARPRIWFGANPLPTFLKRMGELRSVFYEEGGSRFYVDIYDYFAAIVTGVLDDPEHRVSRKDTIITFNYDLVCDDALRRLGVQPSYHLEAEAVSPPGGESTKGSVDLLKLHGSANWGICKKCKHIVILPEKLTHDPYGFRTLLCPNCKESTYQLLLIPPSWDKSEYKDVIRRVWAKALEELRQATRICIVGYSMPEADAFFQYLLTLALSKNDRLYKLIVVDRRHSQLSPAGPSETGQALRSDLETRYRNMLDKMFQERRFSFHGSGVEGFLGGEQALKELGRGEAVSGGVSWK